MIKLMYSLRCKDYPNYPDGYKEIIKVLIRGSQEGPSQRNVMMETGWGDVTAGSESGERDQEQGMQITSINGKRQERKPRPWRKSTLQTY